MTIYGGLIVKGVSELAFEFRQVNLDVPSDRQALLGTPYKALLRCIWGSRCVYLGFHACIQRFLEESALEVGEMVVVQLHIDRLLPFSNPPQQL